MIINADFRPKSTSENVFWSVGNNNRRVINSGSEVVVIWKVELEGHSTKLGNPGT